MTKQEWLQQLSDLLNKGVEHNIINKLNLSNNKDGRCQNCLNCQGHDVVIYYSFNKEEGKN